MNNGKQKNRQSNIYFCYLKTWDETFKILKKVKEKERKRTII